MTKFRLIGQVKDEREFLGYVVLNMETNSATLRTVNEIKEVLARGFIFENVKLENGNLVRTENSLDRLPIFSPSMQLMSKPQVTILGVIVRNGVKTGEYYIMNNFGRKRKEKAEVVLDLIQRHGAVNAKLVPRDGSLVISAIKGNFDEIEVGTSTNGVKKVVIKPSIASSYKKRTYLSHTVECILSMNCLPSQYNPRIFLSAVSVGSDKFDKILSPKDIKGKIAYLYRVVTTPEAYLLSTSNNSVKVGDILNLYSITGSFLRKRYEELSIAKSNYNAKLRTLRELIARMESYKDGSSPELNALVYRKDVENDHLTNAEFRDYYTYTHIDKFDLEVHFGIPHIKRSLYKLKSRVQNLERTCRVPFNELSNLDLPFYNSYIRAGKLDFTIRVLEGTEFLNSITTKQDLLRELDALFLVALVKSNIVPFDKGFTPSRSTSFNRECLDIFRRRNELFRKSVASLDSDLRAKYQSVFSKAF